MPLTAKASPQANSCIHKAWSPLACAIYFGPPSNAYLLSEFTVANKGMGNRSPERSGSKAKERQSTWRNAKLYTLYGEAV